MNRTTRSNWPAGLLAALMCFALWHLAAADDTAETPATAQAINAELDALDARIQRAAAALCRAELGPGTQALWTTDGDLVCRPATVTAEAAR